MRYRTDLDFDLFNSLNLKSNSVDGPPIYDFLLMFNSNVNVSPNSVPLQDMTCMRQQNVTLGLNLIFQGH